MNQQETIAAIAAERAKLASYPVDHNGRPITVVDQAPESPVDPVAAPAGPRTPAPDPSQGARGVSFTPSLDQQMAEAQASGSLRAAIRLQRQKLQKPNPWPGATPHA